VSRPLRIGLNLVYLVEGSGGTGTYARELIPALLAEEPATRITAFVGRTAPASVLSAPWASEVEWVTYPVDYDSRHPSNALLTGAAQWCALPLDAARRRLDLVHGLANVVPIVAPGVARVVTLLDLIWLHFPETMSRRATATMKLTALPSARVAERVIAISHAAKRDMVSTVGIDADRIDVTPLGVADRPSAVPVPEADLRADLGLGAGRVVLCVAQKREHKNLGRLIRAVAGLGCDVMLVLVGSSTPHEDELRALAQRLGAADRIRFPGWLSDAQLEGLYRLAALFVLPSLEEGFGLPLLEAMRRGVPVACSNASSLPEVAGDAAVLFDPLDAGDMRAAISRVLGDRSLAEGLVAAGHERCRRFTWDATARATLASYRRAVAARRGR
jgi:glycosyltransferase involved in cell wall biosynthesis